MRKILVIVLAVILTLSLSLTSVTFAAGGKKEVALAQEAGQAWLDSTVELTGEPLEWIGAHLTTPQVCYGLDGRPSAYMFAMENDGEVLGHIVIGSSEYGYPMLEAADVPAPSIPSADKVKSTLERDLGLKVAKIGNPSRLLYLGFDNLYAIYQAGQQEVAVNLKFDFAIPASDLKTAMPSPEDYEAAKEATAQAQPQPLLSSGYKVLPMYYYSDSASGRKWCGPCSGVSIGWYYKTRDPTTYGNNYPNLPSTKATMYDALYAAFPTFLGYTDPINYGPGFIKMARDAGYYNFGFVLDTSVTSGDYWSIKSAIDNNWPTALCAGRFYDDVGGNPTFPPKKSHYVAIKGYQYPYGSYQHVVICTCSYASANWLYLNWDSLGRGLNTITIKDEIREDFEWGNHGDSLSISGGKVAWTVSTGGSSYAAIDTVKKHSGTRSGIFFCDGSNSVLAYYPESPPRWRGFWLRAGGGAVFYTRNGDGDHAILIRVLDSASGGKLQYYDGAWKDTNFSLSCFRWYFIELRGINWETNKYTIRVDGEYVEGGVLMYAESGYNGITAYYSQGPAGSFWIDDIP